LKLNVNTDASIQLTAKLEKLHRSAFPSAVRNTLNEVAFNAKKIVPKKASYNFTIRQKNLFNRMTLIDKAVGFNVKQMMSKIGVDGSKESLSDGLEKQETGGVINGRKLIAHDFARVSNSPSKKVKSKNLFNKIGKIGTAKERVKGSKYFRIKKGSKETVFERKSKSKITPIYVIRQTNKSKVKAKPFINNSAIKASKEMENIYEKQATYQFKKYLK
jgi:hypothetical protein